MKPLTLAATLAAAALAAPALASAEDITPIHAAPVKPVSSTPVKPVGSTPVKPVGSTGLKPPQRQDATAPLSFFLGAWRTRVPGTSYVTSGTDHDTQHTSLGTTDARVLLIRADRTWVWHGLAGRWRATGDRDYPLVLLQAVDGHDWKVGLGPKGRASIELLDGYTAFEGKR